MDIDALIKALGERVPETPAESLEEVQAVLAGCGYELTLEQVEAFLAEVSNRYSSTDEVELDEIDLDAVAGGKLISRQTVKKILRYIAKYAVC